MPDKAAPETVKKVLFTVLEALYDYLSDIVIVGGWVPQIYAWKEESPEITVRSFDVDAAVAARLPLRGGKGIAAAMETAGFDIRIADSGFALGAFGKKRLQITQFFYRKGRLEVPIEFITPLIGRGEEESTVVQAGLVAPALRYTDILLAHVQTMSLQGETLAGRKSKFTFKVPTIPAFVFAKGLIFERRPTTDKKGKDLAYILEVLRRPNWRKQVISGLPDAAAKHPAGWLKTFKRQLGNAFATEGSKGPAWLALQYPDRLPAEIRAEAFRIFREFLQELG